MSIKDTITEVIKNILEENRVVITDENDYFSNNKFGNVSIKFDLSIDISHIDNFVDTLRAIYQHICTLTEEAYPDVDVYSPLGSGVDYYIIDYDYLFDEYRETSLAYFKNNCDERMVDDIVKKIDHLGTLGFDMIWLADSYFTREEFEKKVKEEEKEITAGYYNLEDDEILKIKYKILNI